MVARLPRYIVGIDLGTTNTVVASADTRAASGDAPPPIALFPIDQLVSAGEVDAKPLLPSVRYHPSAAELDESARTLPWGTEELGVVGELALSMGAKVPGRLVASAKSWLCHQAVDRTAPILPWGAPEDVLKISPVDASASYLRHVARAWDHAHPDDPIAEQEVVLTVPASFDEGARALTLAAARAAGLPEKLRLVEEPQAAFYDWLDRHRATLAEDLASTKLVIVIDVGGGTTDLTLIRVELRDSGPRLTRIAVGDHLMLGGDNMDLALARTAEPRVAGEGALGSARFSQLLAEARRAKEKLLSDGAPDEVRVTVLGTGSRLVGAAKSTEIARSEVETIVLDGFFPKVAPDARPERRRGAIVEFGLPYVADAAITKHIAAFLAQNDELARDALGDASPPPSHLAVADAVLLNGGVFRGRSLARRVLDVVGAWRGEPLRLLDNDAPDLAVARGAVAYGLARRGVGLKIGGGSARTYFLALDEAGASSPPAERTGVCILPRGSEEGEEIELGRRTFSLTLGKPVRFPLVASSQDVRHLRAGDIVPIAGDGFVDLPPIAAVLDAADADQKGAEIPVRLVSALTEIGTLELSFVAVDSARRWKLEFQLRGSKGEGAATTRVTQLHPRFAEATSLVRNLYGKSNQDVDSRRVKTMKSELERILGERASWDTALLRELFGALLSGERRRRRSADHERIWFNFAGYTLRPGFGYPLDPWRIDQLWNLYGAGVQFMPETQNQAEWWIMWRRVAGGLDAARQTKILDALEWYLHPPTKRARQRPGGPKWTAYDDMVRTAGSLEQVAPEKKTLIGDYLVERLQKHGENPQSWWALGRIGARVPFHGSAHVVVPRETAARWLEACLAADWKALEHAPFAAANLARVSGDRERDLPEELRQRVAERLAAAGAPQSWRAMVTEVTHLEAADERRVFGESLPPGLRLLD
jgi:molecular chaperone DnaK (HSP70)